MNTTLVNALVAETEANQAIITTAYNAVEACATARGSAFSGDVTTKAGTRDSSRAAMQASKDCGTACASGRGAGLLQKAKLPAGHNYSYDIAGRHWGNEGSPMVFVKGDSLHDAALECTECTTGDWQGEVGAWYEMDRRCTLLDSDVKRIDGETLAQPDFCKDYSTELLPPSHPHTTSITQRSYYSWEAEKQATDPVYIWFKHMDTFESTNVQTYKTYREECHELRYKHQHRVAESHRTQAQFETDYCAWAHAIDTACDTYKKCYDAKTSTYSTQSGIVSGEEAQFKLQQQALECALCYGNQILMNSTDLTACDPTTDCVNCDVLCIEYPVVHDYIPCSEFVTERPCSAAWTSAEYGCWDAVAPANTCTECAAPLYTLNDGDM